MAKIKNILWLIAFLAVILIWLVYPTFVARQTNNTGAISNLPSQGQYGDQYGGLNALFSGLAFLALIYTVLLQREELSLQRKELKETREVQEQQRKALDEQCRVLEDQRKAMAEQSQTMRQQQIDSTLFALLKQYMEAVEDFNCNSMGIKTLGRDAIREHLKGRCFKAKGLHRIYLSFKGMLMFIKENVPDDMQASYVDRVLYQLSPEEMHLANSLMTERGWMDLMDAGENVKLFESSVWRKYNA